MQAQLSEVKNNGRVSTLSFSGIEFAPNIQRDTVILEKDNNVFTEVSPQQQNITPPPLTEEMKKQCSFKDMVVQQKSEFIQHQLRQGRNSFLEPQTTKELQVNERTTNIRTVSALVKKAVDREM